jgi:hypothetical protein
VNLLLQNHLFSNGIMLTMIFIQVLQIREGQPEKVLQVITGRGRRNREGSLVVSDFHISLLSVIQEDRGEK